ncbi:aldo/keto reductase [Micromonospora sp. URMC 105]|uniref:aldo/keto reductase n=1 Tax=Micromonospora sp. URMC 105 TaxID=3423413 RepID=UPI003F1AD18A
MIRRRMGAAGPEVSAIGLGCMGMSFAYGGRDDAESTRTLHRALDLGVDHLDTADMYGAGANERLLAPVLRARRDEVFLATKFGNRTRGDGSGGTGTPGAYVDSSAAWAREACDASLGRLGIDTIDLYYLHRRDPGTPIEETVGAMAELVAAGKVRLIGLSEVSPATLRAAHAVHAVHPVAAVQMEYSLFTRDVEGEMLDTCRELGVALVAYSPVGRGLLTGAIGGRDQLAADDWRAGVPRFAEGNLDANLRLVAAVRAVAEEIGCTPAQAALAWLLAQGEDVLPIPGTKRVRYLEENAAAAEIRLTPAQRDRLRAAVPADAVAGERYPEASMRTVGH